MGRIVADIADLRSVSGALQQAAADFDQVASRIRGIVQTWALPAGMRGLVASVEADAAGAARRVADATREDARGLDRCADQFDAVEGGSFGGVTSGLFRGARELFEALDPALEFFAGAALVRASDLGHDLRASYAAGRRFAARHLRSAGRTAKLLGRANAIAAPIGWALDYRMHREEGRSRGESVGRASLSLGGKVLGTGLVVAGVALLGVSTGGLGLVAIGVAGGLLGGWGGDALGDSLFGQ